MSIILIPPTTSVLLEFRDSSPPRAPLFNIGREWNVFDGSPRNIKEGGTGCPRTGFANVVLVRGPRIIDLCLPLPDTMAKHRKTWLRKRLATFTTWHVCMHVRVHGQTAFCMFIYRCPYSALTVPLSCPYSSPMGITIVPLYLHYLKEGGVGSPFLLT